MIPREGEKEKMRERETRRGGGREKCEVNIIVLYVISRLEKIKTCIYVSRERESTRPCGA